MGQAAGKPEGRAWRPTPAGAKPLQRVSRSGFDVTPLTAEQQQAEAAGLSDFVRCAGRMLLRRRGVEPSAPPRRRRACSVEAPPRPPPPPKPRHPPSPRARSHVTLGQGTERAFTGETADGLPWDHKGKGTYVSAIGGLPLFRCALGLGGESKVLGGGGGCARPSCPAPPPQAPPPRARAPAPCALPPL
jgi:hypothetical protein